jgi:hypothetical protein
VCDVIVLNAHAPPDNTSHDTNGSYDEDMKRVFDRFPKYHLSIYLREFNAKAGREDIL